MDERTRRIVSVTVELAEKGGFEGVRLRDVADRAGVALGTLYRRFRSKEELLMVAFELQVEAFGRRMDLKPARGGTPLERAESFFVRFTEGICSRPQLARALLRSLVPGGPELAERAISFNARIEAMLAEALCGGGETGPDEREWRVAQALVRVWFALLTGWSSGQHDARTVVAETRSAAELMLGDAADASVSERLPKEVRSV